MWVLMMAFGPGMFEEAARTQIETERQLARLASPSNTQIAVRSVGDRGPASIELAHEVQE